MIAEQYSVKMQEKSDSTVSTAALDLEMRRTLRARWHHDSFVELQLPVLVLPVHDLRL